MRWDRPRILGDNLSSRSFATMCSINKRVFIYGGWGHPDHFVCSEPDGQMDAMFQAAAAQLRDGSPPLKATRSNGLWYIDVGSSLATQSGYYFFAELTHLLFTLDKLTDTILGVPPERRPGSTRTWDPNALGPCLKLSGNNMVCEYIGTDSSITACVRANKPFTVSDSIAYFEVQVISAGANGYDRSSNLF